jgi:hypothetical protein
MHIGVVVDGEAVIGEVVKLTPRLVTIKLSKEYGGVTASLSIPALGVPIKEFYEDEKGMTDKGRRAAETLVEEAARIATIFKKDKDKLSAWKEAAGGKVKRASKKKGRKGPPTEYIIMAAAFRDEYGLPLPIDIYEQLAATL